MACQGCGSGWLTQRGKDCTSCPYCCRLSRCNERKRGRWDGPKGQPFLPNVFKKKRKRAKRASKQCGYCSKRLKSGRTKYCSRKCFHDARNAGQQAWDRTGQLEGCYHRGGRWNNAPSKAYVAVVGRIDAWLAKASGLWKAMLDANAKDIRACVDCGGCLSACHGARKRCDDCRREKKKQLKRERKRLFGNHRRRCRSYGVPFDRTITAVAVFARDSWRCQSCGRRCLNAFRMVNGAPDRRSPTIGHIVALCKKHKGHTWDNVQCECWGCNVEKGVQSKGQHRLMV